VLTIATENHLHFAAAVPPCSCRSFLQTFTSFVYTFTKLNDSWVPSGAVVCVCVCQDDGADWMQLSHCYWQIIALSAQPTHSLSRRTLGMRLPCNFVNKRLHEHGSR